MSNTNQTITMSQTSNIKKPKQNTLHVCLGFIPPSLFPFCFYQDTNFSLSQMEKIHHNILVFYSIFIVSISDFMPK